MSTCFEDMICPLRNVIYSKKIIYSLRIYGTLFQKIILLFFLKVVEQLEINASQSPGPANRGASIQTPGAGCVRGIWGALDPIYV